MLARSTALAARQMRQKAMPVGQLDPEEPLIQHFHYGTFNFDSTFAGHVKISGSPSVTSTVCSK